jgi:hypothetical protein
VVDAEGQRPGTWAVGPRARSQLTSLLLDAAVLLLVFVALRVLLLAAASPSWVPYWDEYDFRRIVERLHESGAFQRSPETSTIALTVAYWGGLFAALGGMAPDALRLSVQALAFAGGLGLDAWLTGRGLARWPRLLLVCAIFVNPVTIGFLNAFTSDVVFLSLEVLALVLLIRGVTHEDLRWLAAGSVVGVLAFGTRELGAALLPAVLVGLWLKRAKPAAYLAAAGPLAAAIVLYFATPAHARTGAGGEHIWGPLKTALAAPLSPARGLPRLGIQVSYLSVFMLEAASLALAPVALLLARHRPPVSGAAARRVVVGVMALWAVVLAAVGVLRLFGRGAPWWPLGEVVGVPLLPRDLGGIDGSRFVFWLAAVLTAGVSLVVLQGGLVASVARRETRATAAMLGVALFATLGVMSLVDSIYSRYAIALLAPLGIAAAEALPRRPSAGALAGATCLFAAALLAGLVVYRVDRATTAAMWAAAGALEAEGVPAKDIHAGYEFLGVNGVLSDRALAMQPGESYDHVVMRVDAPFVVAAGELPPGYRRLEVREVDILPGLKQTIVIGHAEP